MNKRPGLAHFLKVNEARRPVEKENKKESKIFVFLLLVKLI